MPTFTINAQTHKWDSNTEGDKITGTCVWLVRSDEPTTPYQAERAGSPITGIGTTMPGTPFGVPCVSRKGKPVDATRMLFEVTCTYDSTSTKTEDPLDEPVAIDYEADEYEETYFKDKADPVKYAIHTSGEPFSELPKRDTADLVIVLEKNVAATVDYSDYAEYLDPILNDDVVTIDGMAYAAGTLKTTPPRLSRVQTQNEIDYRVVTWKLKVKAEGWNQEYESRGLYGYIEGETRRIADDDGNPVEQPRPLDENGAPLALGATGYTILLKPYAYGDYGEVQDLLM